MDIVNSYFQKLIFTKVEIKEQYAIYAARISETAGHGRMKYVLAFVPVHLSEKQQARLYELEWVNLQTRTMDNYFALKPQKLIFGRELEDVDLELETKSKTSNKYQAVTSFPYEVILLNDPRKKDCTGDSCSIYQYQRRMSLIAAFETFQCVLSLKPLMTVQVQNDIEYI